MTYSSVADIYKSNEEVRARLVARVESLDEAALNFRADEAAWSAAEVVEHLATLEHRLSQLAAMMVGKVEAAAAAATGDAGGASAAGAHFKPFSLDEQIEQARTRKFVAPEEVRPAGVVAVSESLARLRASRAAFEALRPRVERADLSAATYPHPAFGPLNLYQWLAFIGIHEERHLNQIERLLDSRAEG
jgi:hypothetical protein